MRDWIAIWDAVNNRGEGFAVGQASDDIYALGLARGDTFPRGKSSLFFERRPSFKKSRRRSVRIISPWPFPYVPAVIRSTVSPSHRCSGSFFISRLPPSLNRILSLAAVMSGRSSCGSARAWWRGEAEYKRSGLL